MIKLITESHTPDEFAVGVVGQNGKTIYCIFDNRHDALEFINDIETTGKSGFFRWDPDMRGLDESKIDSSGNYWSLGTDEYGKEILTKIKILNKEPINFLNISVKESLRLRESNKRDIMGLLTSERVDLMIDLWNDPKVTGEITTQKAMKYWEAMGYDCSKYTPEEFNRVWDLAQDELDNGGYTDDDEYEEEIETREDAARWLDSKLAEYGNTYHFPQEDKYKLDTLISKFGNTYFWRR